ncbi:MAG: hypothetical protein EXX96DRAFT_627394, partial [Benjaminiella poitrasii]
EATEKEIKVIKLILKLLKPHMPGKEYRYMIAYQLLFGSLANDILSTTKNTKLAKYLFPLSNFARLQTLELNPTSMYQLLISKPEELDITVYDNYKIDSIDFARSNATTVFNSIFNLNSITSSCESYKLAFANHIKIAPGIKTTRLLSTKKDPALQEAPTKMSTTAHILKHPIIIEESKKNLEDLQKNVQDLEVELCSLLIELKKLLKEDKSSELSSMIKEKKAKRKEKHEKRLSEEIKSLKNDRFAAYKNIQTCQKNVSELKQPLYYKRATIQYHDKISSDARIEESTENHINLTTKSFGVYDVDRCRINQGDEEVFVFSGTDNGLVNLAATVTFNIGRYKFHLSLCNKFQVLEEKNDDAKITISEDEKKYLSLPKLHILNSQDIDIGCSQKKVR